MYGKHSIPTLRSSVVGFWDVYSLHVYDCVLVGIVLSGSLRRRNKMCTINWKAKFQSTLVDAKENRQRDHGHCSKWFLFSKSDWNRFGSYWFSLIDSLIIIFKCFFFRLEGCQKMQKILENLPRFHKF